MIHKKINEYTPIIKRSFLQLAFIYGILILIETIKPRIATKYINLILFMLILIALGLINWFLEKPNQ